MLRNLIVKEVSKPRKLSTKDSSKDSKRSLTVNFYHLVLGLNFRGENWDLVRN